MFTKNLVICVLYENWCNELNILKFPNKSKNVYSYPAGTMQLNKRYAPACPLATSQKPARYNYHISAHWQLGTYPKQDRVAIKLFAALPLDMDQETGAGRARLFLPAQSGCPAAC